MEYLEQIISSPEITWQTSLFRMFISFLIGTVIGVERESHNQPAGLRTHILISLGSTIIMLLSIYIPQTYTGFQNGDPGRIAAQVVSGIGFLGAGAIMRFGTDVKGLTTAASIWTVAALGLAIGAGMFTISIIGALIVIFALTIMDGFEKRFFKERSLKKIELAVKKKDADIPALKEILKSLDIKVVSTGIERHINDATDRITFLVGVTKTVNIKKLTELFDQYPGMVSFNIEIVDRS
jgi:putative Mg2+ transporter-C (MgtC) family protein